MMCNYISEWTVLSSTMCPSALLPTEAIAYSPPQLYADLKGFGTVSHTFSSHVRMKSSKSMVEELQANCRCVAVQFLLGQRRGYIVKRHGAFY
jgi:hypothetical protein